MTRPDLPGPLRRKGPRPLWLHLGLSQPAAPGEVPKPVDVDREVLAGIAAYRRHGFQRDLIEPRPVWQEGDTSLLDYGKGRGVPVLFVPSLVNRAYVLDLLAERSMLRWLARRGIRPLLLDWGWPGPLERTLGLSELIAGRLERALVSRRRPVVLAGYCMGGLLALALALRRPALVRGLVLLATPWDFHAEQADSAVRFGGALDRFEGLLQATGTLPIDALQAIFASVEPQGVAAKFRAFARMAPGSAAARDFVALEDWLNDGVPLAAPVAREVLVDWYRDNLPGRGLWQVAGQAVMPQALGCPAFVAVPARDRIVPPGTALALAERIGGAHLHRAASGHIGMVAGPRAEALLWQPLLDWLMRL